MKNIRNCKYGAFRKRRGAAAVELAVVSPLLLALVFGIIEFGWTMMVRETMISAARQGCRTATLKYTSNGALEAASIAKVNDAMSPLGITVGSDGFNMTMSHAADPPVAPNDTETVTLSIPYQQVSLMGNFFNLPDIDIRARIVMRKES